MKKEENEEIWLHTQNPRRFLGFAVVVVVVVVTFFVEILNDFHDFSECVFSLRKSTTQFGRSPIFRWKVTMFIGSETKTYILLTQINETMLAKISLPIFFEKNVTIQHAATNTMTTKRARRRTRRAQTLRSGT